MAKYTVELRKLIESQYDIGLMDYPIFDASYRATLNQKIKDHFAFCEIGAETPGRFKMFLNRTMREIMPLYNQMYASAALSINPLYNFDLTETTTREGSSASEATGSASAESTTDTLAANSDTPASLLSADNIKGNLYASNASRGESAGSSTDSSSQLANSSSLEAYARRLTGSQGMSQSAALLEFRKTFLNIDMMILQDLETCFMGVW